jgi:hypothetical protein
MANLYNNVAEKICQIIISVRRRFQSGNWDHARNFAKIVPQNGYHQAYALPVFRIEGIIV